MRHSSSRPSSRLGGAISALLLACAALGLAAPAAGQTPTKVRYEEVVRSVLYVPMYVALSQGYFKENGLDVSMKTSQGADKGMAALLSGSADIVLIGPEATIYVANSESPVKPKIFSALTSTDGFLLLSRKPVDKFTWDMLTHQSVTKRTNLGTISFEIYPTRHETRRTQIGPQHAGRNADSGGATYERR